MKHKGKSIKPRKIYHKSNPIFRDKITVEGLKPMKGDSYSAYSPEDTEPPAVFGYWGDIDYYDTTFDDDIWGIDTQKIPEVEWFVDMAVSGDIQSAVVTYQPIAVEAITLLYKGTGKSF